MRGSFVLGIFLVERTAAAAAAVFERGEKGGFSPASMLRFLAGETLAKDFSSVGIKVECKSVSYTPYKDRI